MKIVFLGTPAFAAEVLKRIVAANHTVVAVVTQPDRPNKRGKEVEFSEVKKTALELGLPVYQYQKIRLEGIGDLKSFGADVLVTAAYGQILSTEILELAPYGVLNVHASLLPKYRGSSPVQWAILNGEEKLGVTIMKTALSVDSGDMLAKAEITLVGDESTGDVLQLLAPVGAEALLLALKMIENGSVSYERQNESQATHFPMLKKEDGRINFNQSAYAVKNFIRAMNPWPCAFCVAQFGILKVFTAQVIDDKSTGNVGEIVAIDTKNGIVVQTINGKIAFLEVQAEGGKKMLSSQFLLGRKISIGEILQ